MQTLQIFMITLKVTIRILFIFVADFNPRRSQIVCSVAE